MSDAGLEHDEVAAPAPRVPLERAAAVAGLTPFQSTILGLQRSAGNTAVGSLLRSRRRRLARAPALPGFSQTGDTCGAASMVTALFLWDIERSSSTNAAVVHACDLILTEKDNAKANATAKSAVSTVRGIAMTPGSKLGAAEYQSLSMALALLYNGRAGMSMDDINALAKALGFRPFATGSGYTLAEILATDAVTKLKAGEVGQLNWIIGSTGGGHAMLLGRHEDGSWFFADQGPVPATGIQRATHAELVSAILANVAVGNWLYGGDRRNLQSLPPMTGFIALSGIQSFLGRGPSLITPGEALAEIDAGALTTGEVIKAWDYHSRHDSLAAAKDAITKDKGGHGGVIVERPSGMFHVYKTNPISDKDNLKQTSIDADDSKNMVLVKRIKTFYSVWVVLSDAAGNKGTPFEVTP